MLEERIKRLNKELMLNTFRLMIAENSLDYAKRYRNSVRELLYEVKKSYDYYLNLYRKTLLRNPEVILNGRKSNYRY